MPNQQKILPPLDYLLAFEAAAYRQSYVAASQDLNISETAISRKVRLLELHYDVPLFLRRHRSIKLTPQGYALLDKIKPALQILRNASRDMFSEHQNNAVTLAATNSVASLWLMPRLRKFTRRNKHLKIMLVASDNDHECLAETVDLSILRGDGNWAGYTAKLLFGETIFPVCSPRYMETNPQVRNFKNLPTLDLIGVSNTHTEWMNWKTWFNENGVSDTSVEPSAIFNTYPLSIQAAVEGTGIALGWAHLVDQLLDEGKLVRPFDKTDIRTDYGYYLLKPNNRPEFAEQISVEAWLLEASATRKRYLVQSE